MDERSVRGADSRGERGRRLAHALRQNLTRRKSQRRMREGASGGQAENPAEDAPAGESTGDNR